jgi:putative transcriptional regulator
MTQGGQRPIRHHPAEATLLAYAAGTLPEALGIVLATHLGSCATCRAAVAAAEAVGGALLEALPPASMDVDAGAIDRLLDGAYTPRPDPPTVVNPGLAPPLNRMMFGRWWRIGPGLRWRPMRVGGGAWGGLLLAQPGRSLPRHAHKGRELTCLLAGAFVDGGEQYREGDIADPETDHDRPPVVVGDEPCLCVVASEGIRFRGLLGIVQRAAGL